MKKGLITLIVSLFICLTGLTFAEQTEQQVAELAWDVENVHLIDSYRLYMSDEPNVQDTPEFLALEFPNAERNQTEQTYYLDIPIGVPTTYYFVLTAVAGGIGSDKSNEVSKDFFYPSAPYNFILTVRAIDPPDTNAPLTDGGN